MEYVNLVSRRLGVPLPPTLIFDYPTTSSITAYLASKLQRRGAAAATTGVGGYVHVGREGRRDPH